MIRETLAKFSRNGEIHKRSRALRVEHMILLLPLFGLPHRSLVYFAACKIRELGRKSEARLTVPPWWKPYPPASNESEDLGTDQERGNHHAPVHAPSSAPHQAFAGGGGRARDRARCRDLEEGVGLDLISSLPSYLKSQKRINLSKI